MDDSVCFEQIPFLMFQYFFVFSCFCCRQSVEVESLMTAVERLLEYCHLEQEPPAQLPPPYQPPTNWPFNGSIVYEHVSMSHSNDVDTSMALQNISLRIEPREKIGIVGRTGAGKTSFIQVLFRLGNVVEGKIFIDNIDILKIGLNDLRRRLSIIPQDPVLFVGTIRDNLDQFGNYSDVEIWNALEQVRFFFVLFFLMAFSSSRIGSTEEIRYRCNAKRTSISYY